MKKTLLALGSTLASLIGVGVCGATEFSTTTAIASANTLSSDVSTIMYATVGTILSLMAALLGLGWAVRKFKSKVTGKKF